MAEATSPGTPRMSAFATVVVESVVETADTRTLVLDPGSPRRDWLAGQYLSIDPHQFPALASVTAYLEHRKGRREAPRAYSMSSTPEDRYLAVTVKEERFVPERTAYPPLLSGYLVHSVRPGDEVAVRAFAGTYVLPADVETRTSHLLHLCAGSGSVPNVSIIRDALVRFPSLRHTLVYSNKTWDEIIFRDALEALQGVSGDRLRVVHFLTRDPGADTRGPGVRRGRVDLESVRDILGRDPDSLIYACGPAVTVWERRACAATGATPAPQFLEAMNEHLQALGVPRQRIHTEAFG